MDPEVAAMSSTYSSAANVILGSEKFMPPELAEAPEIKLPPGAEPEFVPLCPKEVRDKYDEIWADLTK